MACPGCTKMDIELINVSLSTNHGWMRLVWKPNTADELFDVLMAFKEQDPNGNGQADEIPFSFYKDRKFDLLMSAFGVRGV